MGISPVSDFVVDVMKNAETSSMREVVSKLKALSPGSSVDSAEFSATMAKTDSANAGASTSAAGNEDTQAKALAAMPSGLAFSGTSLTALRNAHALSNRTVNQLSTTQPSPALKKFEGMVLGKFLDTMMPQSSSVFGNGVAGSSWRTMLAEKIGDAIADAGGIGIAASIVRATSSRHTGGNGGGGS